MTSASSPGGPSWQQKPAASHPAGPPASSSFFRWLRGLDITRTPDRWVGGVAGGVARRTGLDLALVRGLIVILAVFGGIGVLLYGLAWALLPEPDGRIHVEEAGRGSWTSGLTGAAVLVAIGLWRPNLPLLGDGGAGGLLWTLFWIGAVVLFVYWIVNRSSGGRPGPDVPGSGPSGSGTGFDGGGPVPATGPAPFGPAPFDPAEPPAPGASYAADAGPDGPATDGPDPNVRSRGTEQGGERVRTSSGAPDAQGGQASDDDTNRTVPLPYRYDAPSTAYTPTYPLPYEPGSTSWPDGPSGYPASYPLPDPTGSGRRLGPRTLSARTGARRRHARPSGPVTALIIGGAIVIAAVLLTLDYLDVVDLVNPPVVALAAAAMVLGLGVILLGARGRTSGLVGLTAGLATLGALVASFSVVGGAWIVTQHTTTTPVSLEAAANGYSVMAADTTIDLTNLPAPAGDVVVPVNSLASKVTVIVPDDMPVEVRTRMALGSADATGTAGGPNSFSGSWNDEGLLQLRNGDLNPGAAGAAIILDVRGAMSDVSILTAPGTTSRDDNPTPTGDEP